MASVFDNRRPPVRQQGYSRQRVNALHQQGAAAKQKQRSAYNANINQLSMLGYAGYKNKDEITEWAKDKYRSITGKNPSGADVAKAESIFDKEVQGLIDNPEGSPTSLFDSRLNDVSNVDAMGNSAYQQSAMDPYLDSTTTTTAGATTTTAGTTADAAGTTADAAAAGSDAAGGSTPYGSYARGAVDAATGKPLQGVARAVGAYFGSAGGPWGSAAGGEAAAQLADIIDGPESTPVGPAPWDLTQSAGQSLVAQTQPAAPLLQPNLFSDVVAEEDKEPYSIFESRYA